MAATRCLSGCVFGALCGWGFAFEFLKSPRDELLAVLILAGGFGLIALVSTESSWRNLKEWLEDLLCWRPW